MVQNKRSKVNYKVKKVIRNNPKDYIIVEILMNQLLIKKLFMKYNKEYPKMQEEMNYYRTYMKQKLCTTNSNNYDELEKTIINSITNIGLNYINRDKIRNNVIINLNEDNKNNSKKELEILTNDIK